ncbi:MAG: SRPBCC domain-containing protein [Alphaproteobacteria bacterium]|nr:SRPBCC domain-containing protein [Alphaproteobacteria bacterium]MCW5743271.1 SRPBCC domain-containing protein [Alphaproteobacteria bacterium]
MPSIDTSIDIAASPARVWSVLTDFASYPAWNPFITRVAGLPVVGDRLVVTIQPPGRRAMMFRPVVLAATPEVELRWRGRLLMPGLFDGEHVFRLTPADGGCRLDHGEIFTGLLSGLLRGTLPTTRRGFVAMNEALKARAESVAASA